MGKQVRHEYKRSDIVDTIIKMRIKNMASTKTIIKDFLQGELGYGVTYSYELYKEAREKIVELYEKSNLASLEEAIGQLEEMIQEARHQKNDKFALEIRKEISKISGLYIKRVDITSKDEKLEGFVIKIVKGDDEKEV